MTLSLFPSRVRIADENGQATPEFIRAMNTVFERLGGFLGDEGMGDIQAAFASLAVEDLIAYEAVTQPATSEQSEAPGQSFPDVVQQGAQDFLLPDVTQPRPAEASELTGRTLASNVTQSSLTTLGTLTSLAVAGAAGINGKSAVTSVAAPSVATDLPTVLTLANNIRTRLINFGIYI